MEPKSPHMRMPLDADPTIFIWAYTNTREIRIRFDEGGFVKWRLFRHVFKSGRKLCDDDPSVETVRSSNGILVQRFPRGPVVIETTADLLRDRMKMKITVELPDRKGTVEKVLDHETCVEIAKRLRQAETLVSTYEEDLEEEAAA